GYKPVANMESFNPLTRAVDRFAECWVPPNMVAIDGDTHAIAELVAQVERLINRREDAAISTGHWVEWFERQGHPGSSRIAEDGRDPVAHHLPGAGKVARAGWQAANDHHQACRAKRMRFGYRAPVFFDCGSPASRIACREHAPAAEARNGKSGIA